MATHSSILAWKIQWTEEPGGLQSIVSQRVGRDCIHEVERTHLLEWPYSKQTNNHKDTCKLSSGKYAKQQVGISGITGRNANGTATKKNTCPFLIKLNML